MQTEVYGGMTAASATVGAKIGKKDETWKKKKEKIALRGEIYDFPMTSELLTLWSDCI